jgi:hypothetical protein
MFKYIFSLITILILSSNALAFGWSCKTYNGTLTFNSTTPEQGTAVFTPLQGTNLTGIGEWKNLVVGRHFEFSMPLYVGGTQRNEFSCDSNTGGDGSGYHCVSNCGGMAINLTDCVDQ